MLVRRSIVLTLLLVGIAAAVPAQPPLDLTGSWRLDAEFVLSSRAVLSVGGPTRDAGEAVPACVYEGTIVLDHDGGAISGPATLSLVSGPLSCPAEMMADLVGTADPNGQGAQVDGTLSGPLGTSTFTGQISPNPGGSGTSDVTGGVYTGSTGTWAASLSHSVLAIPVVSPVGLALLTLLLLGLGAWMLARST